MESIDGYILLGVGAVIMVAWYVKRIADTLERMAGEEDEERNSHF